MAVDAARAKSLYLAAADLSAADRTAFLDHECGNDADLRSRVEALLAADASGTPATGDFTPGSSTSVSGGAQPATGGYHSADAAAGTVIAGKYSLVEPIGEGGMGSVWRARQTEPVKRFVAVKLIKAGMDSKQVLARFEAERQALALMDHPNIAKVLDGGLHDHRPFFVMELVKGVPITEYCDARRLTPQHRLELFVQACHAIQHAHQKGIIHRDIKPSNVLVALYDDKPVVKVIDFGVAKATGGTLSEATMDTSMGVVVGTPQYMSPEQATFNNQDIDTRSDVYALGVLLYELLVGSPPFSGAELRMRGFMEILRVVREEDPPRPSTKLSTADALPSLSANRGTEPKKLTGLLRNELDWIVMKALEKDRARRYETANGFAADCLRYLAGEAVIAHPPSTAYRLKKFVKRNQGRMIAASLVLFALLAGIVGTTLGLWEAKKQEQLAEKKRQEAETQQRRAEAGEKLAGERLVQVEAEKQITQAVNDFLQYKLLAQADTTEQANQLLRGGGSATGAKHNPTIKELLDRAAAELAPDTIEANFPQQPLVQAQILRTVGDAYRGVGEAATGIPFFIRSADLFKAKLGPDHHDTLTSMNNLARGYLDAGKLDLALPLFEETLKLTKAKLGPDHPDTFTIMNNLARGYLDAGKLDLALPLFEETLKLTKAKFGPDHPDTLSSMNSLALGHQAAGKLDLAVPLFEETLKLQKAKLGPDHPSTLTSMANLALGYQDAGKLELALPLYEENLKIRKAKLGADHPDTLTSMNNLAGGYRAVGKRDLALPLLEETSKLMSAKLGVDHPHTLYSMNNLAEEYRAAGKLDLALPLYEETLKLMKAKLGPDQLETLSCMNNLALGYLAVGKLDLALPLLEETIQLQKAKLGADHPHTLLSRISLAMVYRAAGKLDLAVPLLEETIKRMKTKLGPDHPDTLTSMNNLANCYWSLKQLDKSVPLFEESLSLQEKKLGRGHASTQRTVANLGVNYKDAGKLDLALPLLEEAYRSSRRIPTLRWVGFRLLEGYIRAGMRAEALKLKDELLAHARQTLPAESPQLAATLAQYGLALLDLGAFADAEPLLRECLAIRGKKEPDTWTTFNTQSLLGGALLGQKKHADAEPLLKQGYEGMKAREKTIPTGSETRIPEALDRLIELYTATNKPDEVKKWREERARHPTPKKVIPPPKEEKK